MRSDCEDIIHQLVDKDNWQAVDMIDSFLYIVDRMPDKMRMVVDFRVQGYNKTMIAHFMKITENAVAIHLTRAKKRIIKAMF